MQMALSENKINELIAESVLLNVREVEFKQVLKEVYPYFRGVLEEENSKLRRYMLVEGYISHYEYMLNEQKQLEEGWMDIMADVGITAGQMVGGAVGQAAGLAGAAKYGKDLIGVIDKSFLEMVGPLLGFFFSIQALVFPMPAVGTVKGILLGFFKGVGNVIKGVGGLLAKGVTILLSKGAGFISKAIGILAKAMKGVMGKVSTGGPMVQKITAKFPTFGKGIKALQKGMESLMQRLGILADGLKIIGKQGGKAKQLAVGAKAEQYGVKALLGKAFKTSADDLGKVSATVKAGVKNPKKVEGMFSKASRLSTRMADDFAPGLIKNAAKKVTKVMTDKGSHVPIGKFVSGSGKDLAGGTFQGIIKGQAVVANASGKVYTLSANSSAKLIAQNPGVAKFVMSNADDAAAAIIKKNLAMTGKIGKTKIAAKVISSELKKIPSKLLAVFKSKAGNTARSLNKWITNHMAKNPQLIEGMIGTTIKGATKGHKYTMIGVNRSGKILIETNKVRGKIVEPFMKAVPPNMFFSSYGRQFFNPKLASKSNVFKHFLGYLRHVYPPQRAIADMARIKAATGKDARIVPGSFGQVEMPD